MTQPTHSYCRHCAGLCGVLVSPGEARLRGDRDNPKSLGFVCPIAESSLRDEGAERLSTPRLGERDISWDEALEHLRPLLREAASKGRLGIYAGGDLAHDHLGALRTLGLALGTGSRVYSPLAQTAAPVLRMTELMMGRPAALQSDVGRSHATLLLSAHPEEHRWDPLHAGTTHSEALRYFHKTRKQVKLFAASHRAPAGEVDLFLNIRCGSELYLLLGLCHLFLNRGWSDEQFLRDYCDGVEELRELLAPWTLERVSQLCDVPGDALAGLALKLSRTPMAVIHCGPEVFQTEHASLTAWAWLLAHALTANLLRPGGLFEAQGLLDLPFLSAGLPTERGPRSLQRGAPSLLMQLPSTLLAEDLSHPEGPELLLCMGGSPALDAPASPELQAALEGLSCMVLVQAAAAESPHPRLLQLPTLSPWEREDLHLLDHAWLPTRMMQWTPAVKEPYGESRSIASIAETLSQLCGSAGKRGPWGRHFHWAGRKLAGLDLQSWTDRLLDWLELPSLEQLRAHPGALDQGEIDRAAWRVERPGGRLDLSPPPVRELLRQHTPPETSSAVYLASIQRQRAAAWGLGEEPRIRAPLESELEEGQLVQCSTLQGEIRGRVQLDERLRPGSLEIPWELRMPANGLMDPQALDPLTFTARAHGLPCELQAIED